MNTLYSSISNDRRRKGSDWRERQMAIARSSGVVLFFGAGEAGKTAFATSALASAVSQNRVKPRAINATYAPLESMISLLTAWLSEELIHECLRVELFSKTDINQAMNLFYSTAGITSEVIMRAIQRAIAVGNRDAVNSLLWGVTSNFDRLRESSGDNSAIAPKKLEVSSPFVEVAKGVISLGQNGQTAPRDLIISGLQPLLDDAHLIDHAGRVKLFTSRRLVNDVWLTKGGNHFFAKDENRELYVANDEQSLISFLKEKNGAHEVQEVEAGSKEQALKLRADFVTFIQDALELASTSVDASKKRDVVAFEQGDIEFDDNMNASSANIKLAKGLSRVFNSISPYETHLLLVSCGLYEYVLAQCPRARMPAKALASWLAKALHFENECALVRTELKDEAGYACILSNDSLENKYAIVNFQLPDGSRIVLNTASSLLSLMFGALLLFPVVHFSAIDMTATRSIEVKSSTQKGGLDSSVLNVVQNISDAATLMGVLVVAELRDDFTSGADANDARQRLGAVSRYAVHISKPTTGAASRDVWLRTKSYGDGEEAGSWEFEGVTLADMKEATKA